MLVQKMVYIGHVSLKEVFEMTVHYLILHNQLVATHCQSRWFWDNAKSYKCLDSRVMVSVIELYPRPNYKDLKTDKNRGGGAIFNTGGLNL